MKLLYTILFSFILTGCSLFSHEIPKFPDYPKEIGEKCPDLDKVKEGETKLSEVVKVVTTNYSKYHECQTKVDLWVQWYNEQKSNYESVKK